MTTQDSYGEPLQCAAAGHEEVTFLFPENANHVLKQELRPREDLTPSEIVQNYNGPGTRLDPQALVSIRGPHLELAATLNC